MKVGEKMKDMEMSQAFLFHQAVFKLSLKSQTYLCVYLRDMPGLLSCFIAPLMFGGWQNLPEN